MSLDKFRGSVSALSGEHSIEILLFLRDRGWSIAFDVAKELMLHPTTVIRYLSKLHRAGIISRRAKKHKTGRTFEYRLKTNKISLSLDLNGEERTVGDISPAIVVISRIIDRLEKIGSSVSPKIFRTKREKEIATLITSGKRGEVESLALENVESLYSVLKTLIEYSEKSLGRTMTRDIILPVHQSLTPSLIQFMPEYIQEVIR